MPDIAQGPSTTATIAPGEILRSRIDTLGDKDWVRIELTRGDWVQVDLRGRGTDPLDDPLLRIRDRDGDIVARNDDGGAGRDARLTFQATYSGEYYIIAAAYGDESDGQYALEVQEAPASPADASLYWGEALPDTHVTVYFAEVGERFDGYTSEGFNAFEKARFREAFDRLEAVSGLTFEVVTEASGADFRLVLDLDELDAEDDGTLGYFNPPGEPGAGIGVFNGSAWDREAGGDLRAGGLGFVTITHEILHGLGLAHPHDRGGGSPIMPGVTSDFDDYGNFDLNQGIFTTMSYNSGYWTGSPGSGPRSVAGYEKGPMALDIAVLQTLYGAGGAHRAGDSTYRLPDLNRPGVGWQALWDTGGQDRITYDGDRDTVIDLRPATLKVGPGGGGFVSAAEGVRGGVTIAKGVWIEEAHSGAGNDRLTGNARDNVLDAGGGADVLRGRAGDDLLLGGAGRDQLIGAGGADALRGGQGDDLLRGGTGSDVLRGEDGADVLRGGGGADILRGGAGADRFDFNRASDSGPGDTRDVIADFGRGRDVIDLRGIDADTTRAGNQAFDFIGTAGFDAAGQLRVARAGEDRILQADRNGDGETDFAILLTGADGLRGDDFLL